MIICVTAVVLIVSILQAIWPFLLAAILAAVAGWVGVNLHDSHRTSATATRQRQAAIAARADRQHNMIMSGDFHGGTYGDYPPAE